MEKQFDIIGVGDSDVDIMLKVDRLPKHDEKRCAKLLGRFPGGMVANFCCAASNFGARVGIVTTVGDDEYGHMAIRDFHKYGVDTAGVVVKEGEDTYFSIAQLDATGEKAMTVCLTSATMPENEDVDLDYVKQARFVQLMGSDERLGLYVGQFAKKHGIKVSYDIEHAAGLHSDETKKTMMKCAYIVFPNEAGLASYTGCDSVEQGAQTLLAMGPEIVVVTQGSKGVDVFTKEQHFHQDALKVDVQDTTGAGDCFNGVFLSCLSKGYSLKKCAKLATGAAALAIQKIGSRTGFQSESEVITFLSKEGNIVL